MSSSFLSSLLAHEFLGHPSLIWLIFLAFVLAILFFDLFVLSRKSQTPSVRSSLALTGFYVFLASCFGLYVSQSMGSKHALEFYTAYLIEFSLSMDNLFVMSVILASFAIPLHYQHRVLFWGILGVLVTRGIMIGVGASLLQSFAWLVFIFAALLIFTGLKMLLMRDHASEPKDNKVIRFLSGKIPLSDRVSDNRFFIRETLPTGQAIYLATPLFMALVSIEIMDVFFALDSVPAVLAISSEPFVIYTSNIFAILGLRAMYFSLSAVLARFSYMKYALSIILILIGGKVFWNHFIGHIEPLWSLLMTVAILLAGILCSLFIKPKHPHS
jgi:tellurite resistance protein TerC